MPIKLNTKTREYEAKPTTGWKKKIKELGYTETQMDAWYKEALELNFPLCKIVDHFGGDWRCMGLHQLSYLPNFKEKYEKQQAEKLAKEQQEKEEKLRMEQDKQYRSEHLEEILLSKIENEEELSDQDLDDFKWCFGKEVAEIAGEPHRWQTPIRTIKEYKGRYFEIDWMRGNTECQENEWDGAPYEVTPYEKTVIDYKKKF